MNKKGKSGLMLLIVVILIILAWGYIGGLQAQSTGISCDFGAGEMFCWKWHTNTLGATGEIIRNIFG